MACVKSGRMQDFRHRFRNLDVLVIDDIHFLSKREQSQEEFFHTFNTLYQSGKQIILSSDASPNDIPDLEERLVSRFNCGLVARVDRPCYETRVAILKSKAALINLAVPDDVCAYIAARIDSNIRELEGALTKVRGYAMANKVEINLDIVKVALADDRVSNVRSNQPSIQMIIDAVTVYYDIKLSDLMSKRRHKSIALPRQVCMWLARKHTRYSLEEIGGYFGGRDHTTVLHAVRTIGTRRDEDPDISKAVDRIESSIVRNSPVG
jgi:chromosomal replication initiator protein